MRKYFLSLCCFFDIFIYILIGVYTCILKKRSKNISSTTQCKQYATKRIVSRISCAAPKIRQEESQKIVFFFSVVFFLFRLFSCQTKKTKAPRRKKCVCAIRCSNYKPGKDVYNLYTQLLPSDCRYDSIKTLHHESRRLASSAS